MKPRTWNISELLRHRRQRARLLGLLALLAFALSAVFIIRVYWTTPPKAMTISAGNMEGMWHRYMQNFVSEIGGHHLPLHPIITTGTLDMLERVDRGELDFALVQGGYDITRFSHVRQVGALSVQPLHLLVKSEHHDAAMRDFGGLRGKTINLGSGKRTGTYWLSKQVLSFAGLSQDDYKASGMTSDELAAERDRSKLPDAIFIVTRPPSELVKSLVDHFGYRLVPLPFGYAFRATAMLPQPEVPAEGVAVRKEHILDALIPAYSYGVSPPTPPQDIPTLGSRMLLITHERMSNRIVIRLLDDLLASRYAHVIQPPLTVDIVRQPAEAPWHPAAVEYRRRDDPVITGELIGILSNTLQVIVPIGGGILLVWGWLRARVLTHRERRIDRFIALVSGVEQRALQVGQGRVVEHSAVSELHRELSTIKDAALERIAAGEAGNELLVSSLFAHISDVRAYLADLERDVSRVRSTDDGHSLSAHSTPQ
jgi:TRAP-type uncharacterized transport system substrate-binding protein